MLAKDVEIINKIKETLAQHKPAANKVIIGNIPKQVIVNMLSDIEAGKITVSKIKEEVIEYKNKVVALFQK